MIDNEIKVLGVGSPILDLLLNVDDDFISTIHGGKGGMVHVDSEEMSEIIRKSGSKAVCVPGGSAANTIFALSQLGVPTAFLGKTGKDKDGDFYVNRYHKMGGDISHFKWSSEKATGKCLSLITPDGERTMRTHLGAAADLTLEDIQEEDFSDITHVHTEGYLLFNRPVLIKIFELAKSNYCTVSLDLASYEVVESAKDILPDILRKYVDIILANEDEAKAFTETSNFDWALEIFSELCFTSAIKIGKRGALIKNGSEKIKVPAILVNNPVDTTGAGDLWASGFLFGFLNNKKLEECGKFASLLGSEIVQVIGASIPENRWRKIKEIIK